LTPLGKAVLGRFNAMEHALNTAGADHFAGLEQLVGENPKTFAPAPNWALARAALKELGNA
jgi:hypothetical protein